MHIKQIFLICLLLFPVLSCTHKTSHADDLYLLVGTYTSGTSEGIYVYRFDTQSAETKYVSQVKVSNPSYLTLSSSEKYVYAVNENDETSATANAFTFDKTTGSLKFLNSHPTQGGAPCYINTDPEGKFVVTANYSGGNISVFPIADDGSLLPASQVFGFEPLHTDPVLPSSRLHSVVFSPDFQYLFAADLGKDMVYRFSVNKEVSNTGLFLTEDTSDKVNVETGSGPRHLTFHPNGKYAYLINELSGKVTTFEYDGGHLTPIQYIASDTTAGPGKKGSADIHLTPDGKFLYASNRLKADGIAIFSVDQQTGKLTSAGYQPTGIHPRNFIITPDGTYLLVANRDSNNIQIFEIDKNNGSLKDTGREISLDKPVCLKFAGI